VSERQSPTPEEIQKDLENYARRRFGGSVHIFSGRAENPRDPAAPAEGEAPRSSAKISFDLKPKDVKAYLDRFVIKQDDAKKALAIAVCDHYNYVMHSQKDADVGDTSDYAKQNVLLLGPTGVGKTYLIKQIAKLIGVPFVKADATRFSETGYVGANVDDLVRDLVTQADGDIELAQYGIIYLDEADKLASAPGHGGRDVSGRGVQFGLLKLMEETEIDLTSGNDLKSQMQAFMEMQQKGRVEKKVINTRNILFIVSGAFSGLDELIQRRVNQQGIGFNASAERQEPAGDWLHLTETKDLIDFGFEPEFVGRLPVRVACHHLTADDLEAILKESEGSILRQYEQAFSAYGISVSFDDQAIRAIAARAASEKTGARALMTTCERLLRDYKFELPSSAVREFVVTEELVNDQSGVLARLLADPVHGQRELDLAGIRQFETEFAQAHGMGIRLDESAVEATSAMAQQRQTTTHALLAERLACYEHGLKLVQQTTGQSTFMLGRAAVEQPQMELERLIMESYSAAVPQGLPH